MRATEFSRSRCIGVVGGLCLVLLSACSTTRVDTSNEPGPAAAGSAPGEPALTVPADRPVEVFPDPNAAEPFLVGPGADLGNPLFYDVFGERYFVLDSGDGYVERGIASWYGDDFHGLATSGGEVYDMYAMTAAHRTLPIPTWVEVTNLANDRRVVVKVNDRGPFVDDRLIDLSFRAADFLGMVEEGTTLVEVRALDVWNVSTSRSDSPAAADAAAQRRSGEFSSGGDSIVEAPGPDSRALRRIFLQVGVFAARDNADRLSERLVQNGFDNSLVATADQGTQVLHRVLIGPLDDAEHTDEVNAGLRSIGIDESQLVFGY